MAYKFISKWDEDTEITYHKNSRIEQNRIIEIYNKWQIDFDFNKRQSRIVLANIEYGKQTYASKKSGSLYLEQLNEMKEFVKSNARFT